MNDDADPQTFGSSARFRRFFVEEIE